MIEFLIMMLILIFMGIELFYNAKFLISNNCFFDIKNTTSLRGFWIIWVILVHAPQIYHNKIQDMIGSFGYIAITFFFMTSAYGLTLAYDKNPDSLKYFWRKRLPKLLVVSWIANIIGALLYFFVFGKPISVIGILKLSGWIEWLIACYFAFWICNKIFKNRAISKILCSVMIIIGSLIMYYLKASELITTTTWHTECFGFIWGIALASLGASNFLDYFVKKWEIKWGFCTIACLILGCTYIKFKPVFFIGDYLIKVVLGAAITLFVLIANTRIDFGNKISLFMGKLTFEVYLTHGFVIDLLKGIHKWKVGGLYTVSCIILTIIFSTIVHLISDIIMKKVSDIPFLRIPK